MLHTCYAGGPIANLQYDDAVAWRTTFAAFLLPDIVVYSPMRAKAFLRASGLALDAARYTHTLATPQGIVARDRFDVRRSDMVAFNFLDMPDDDPSCGSLIEIGWGDAFDKPMAAALRPDSRIARHPMVAALIPFQVESLTDLIAVVRAVLLPERGPGRYYL